MFRRVNTTNTPILIGSCVAVHLLVWGPVPAWSAGDAAVGQQTFATHCAICHATAPGQNKVGPSLAGVYGTESGKVAGYNFSDALKNAHLTLDDATLDKWLQSPSGLVPGAKMFANLASSEDRQNVIAYVKTLSTGDQATPGPTP